MARKIAFLFPGQGSQYVGMGLELTRSFPRTGRIYETADAISNKPVSRLCFEGPMDALTQTVNQQPAITAVNLACLSVLKDAGIGPSVVAGHSLGEYAALAAAGVLSEEDALALVNKRGEVMHRESIEHPGAMAAVIGLPLEAVQEIVGEARGSGVLGVANHNTAEQIVITGEKALVSAALDRVKERRGKGVPLKVSGAWHCSLMEKAVGEFRRYMDGISFSRPEVPVLFNATAGSETDPEKIKDIMAMQLVSPVKWYPIIQKMHAEDGIDVFVEVGPKKVLTGLVKKIIPPEAGVMIRNVEDGDTLEGLLEVLGS